MTIVAFTILGQPVSLKNSYRIILKGQPGGKQFPGLRRSDDAEVYARDFLRQLPASAKQMLEGPLRVTMRLYYSWEGPDLCEAFILDLMQPQYDTARGKMIKLGDGQYGYEKSKKIMVTKGVYHNDRQVRVKHIEHFIDKANPRAEIEVETMQAQQPSLLDDVPLLQTSGSKDPF